MASLVIAGFGTMSAHAEPDRSAGPQLIQLGSPAVGIAIDENTDMIYVELYDGDVAVVDGTTNKVVASIPLGSAGNLEVAGIAADSTRNRIYVISHGSSGSTVEVINGATNQVVRTMVSTTQESGVAVDPLTNRLYVSRLNVNRLAVYRAGTGTIVKRITVGKFPTQVAVDPTTDTIFLAHAGAGGVQAQGEIISGKTNKVLRTLSTGDNQSVSVDPTTRRIYVTDGEGGSHPLLYVLRTTPNGKKTTIIDRIHLGLNADPTSVAVDRSNHLILVQRGYSASPGPQSNVAVIDGSTDHIVRKVLVGVDSSQIAVNPATHIAYTTTYPAQALAILRDA
jgi:DNA-binding beta-propeller fold protein YncE